MSIAIEYTADDEMPNCGKCDHICDDFNCCDWCGAEHGWWGYKRTVVIDDGERKTLHIQAHLRV